MTLVKDTYYEHDIHGRVRIENIEDDVVVFTDTRGNWLSESKSRFDNKTEPAEMRIDASTEQIGLEELTFE